MSGLLGALVGGAGGFAYAYAFRMPMTPTASIMMSIVVGALVSGLLRRPPWRQASAVESLLRAVLGGLLGAGLAWLLRRVADPEIPFALPPLPRGTRFSEHAWLFPLVVGALAAMIVGRERAPRPASPSAGSPSALSSLEKPVT